MQLFVVALCLFAVAAAAPLSPPLSPIAEARRRMPALDHEEVHDEYGQYALRYVTAEGTIFKESGRLVPNKDHTGYVMVVEGDVSYIGDDGQVYTTKYTAGLDGSHIETSHIPAPVAVESIEVIPERIISASIQ